MYENVMQGRVLYFQGASQKTVTSYFPSQQLPSLDLRDKSNGQ